MKKHHLGDLSRKKNLATGGRTVDTKAEAAGEIGSALKSVKSIGKNSSDSP